MSSKDLEFQNYTLGDIKVIELLLSLRYKYDDYLFMRGGESSLLVVNGIAPVNEEVLLTYASLDEYIKRCKFNNEQLEIMKMVGEGYSYEEVAYELNLHVPTIAGRLKTMYKKIAKENERQWRRVTYEEKLGLKNKRCSKCKENLPATPEFYGDLKKTKDGFHSQCRNCKT